MKNGEIAEQGSHEDLIKKKVCSCKCFKGILLFSNYRTVIMRAWSRLMLQELLTKETERKAKLVRKNSKFRLIFSSNRNKQHEP